MDMVLIGVAYVAAALLAVWFVLFLPYQMAERRRRRGWNYVLLSLLLTPMLVVPMLWVMGGAPQKAP